MTVSILINTLNEEVNLPGALDSVTWSDDVIVLDSFSNDKTVEIAEKWGARIYKREFDSYSKHWNWAMMNIPFKHEWVFVLDADERVPPSLRRELIHVARTAGPEMAAYRLRFKNYFFGRWIKHSSLYPSWITRFLRPNGRALWEDRSVNAHPLAKGEIGFLKGHFHHYSFNRGLEHWFAKHNQYSTMEAEECVRSLREESLRLSGLWDRDPVVRRKSLKSLSFRLPMRPLLKFGYMYGLRGGFLDGGPGFTYCALQAAYEYMIVVKMREIERRNKGLPI